VRANMMRRGVAALLLWVVGAAGPVQAQQTDATDESRTASYLESVRGDTPRLTMFLREMPKGGELHSHLSGAIYAETYIDWAAAEGLCIDTAGWTLARPPCDAAAGRPPALAAQQNPALRDGLVDAMSVRNWHPAQETGHARFFGAFDRFRLVSFRTGDMLAEVASRAAANRVSYMEQMVTADGAGAAAIARQVGWDPDLDRLRTRLLAGGLRDTLARARERIDLAEARQRELLGCDAAQRDPGCGVIVRYQYQALRARPPEVVFAHLLAGFELAAADARFVGVNLVQPEDHPVSLRDYELHMQMIGALRSHYPQVPVTLHAGELAPGLVKPEDLRSHIRLAVEVAGARRIGHGVSIAHEEGAAELLARLAQENVLVEVALSSNESILGVRGRHHPLGLFLRHGVPVALVTDDEGVLRSEMTMEYLKAVEEHGVGYMQLKRMARNSLEHAFVEGPGLWADAARLLPVPECAARSGGLSGERCMAYIAGSTRARLQHELERAFTEFERVHGSR
jgi:adenosine deaminase